MDKEKASFRVTRPELTRLINSFDKQLIHFGPRASAEIIEIEYAFDINLPEDYKQFLEIYGALTVKDVSIIGIGVKNALTVSDAILELRLAHNDMPLELVPIEELGDGYYACIVCQRERSKPAPVVIVNAEDPKSISELPQIALSFQEYLWNRLVAISSPQPEEVSNKNVRDTFDKAWSVFMYHVNNFQNKHSYDHAKGGKLPRNTDWRPYRYCIQDVVFGVTVVRHDQEGNFLQIDVFLTADVPEYGPLAGARALTAFLLSEAYKCGGTMELRFTKNVEGGQIPAELQGLARQYGIQLGQKIKGRIEPAEAKALYAAMTGFSQELQNHIQLLEKVGKLQMARACYVVHHGVWSKEQLEMIVLGSENPESILGGQAKPEQRHLYHHDLLHARAALMAGMFERIMLQRERQSDDGVDFDMEDDFRKVEISFDGQLYTKYYHCSEPIELAWLYGIDIKQSIPENILFQVLVRARDQADLRFHITADIQTAAKMKADKNAPAFLLVPRDFIDMPKDWISQIQSKAAQAGIGILVCPESANTLDVDANQRLATSRVLRQ
ncbi:MAG: SMI1/KNR4 family protein [Proteobacteria bacterium]|nr:SMI1/KNR4 family protein [Pseudomonadota bacterium]